MAHVLRRTTFGPFPGQTEHAVEEHRTVDVLIDHQLGGDPLAFVAFAEGTDLPNGGKLDIDGHDPELDLRRYHQFTNWWLNRMRSDEAGLHEKLSWFWHTHFTTSSFKCPDNNLGWRQLRTLHQHALGNFGDLAKALTVDGAMLVYLDGDGSEGSSPNENYARELMELFTLGVGNYTQADVAAAAKALSGWLVNFDQTVLETPKAVTFVPERSYRHPVTFLGRTARFRPDDVIDQVLEQEACAPFVVAKLWTFLIGGPVDPALIDRWSRSFRSSGYEIAPLVADMLRSSAFATSIRSRARTAIEWYCTAVRATGMTMRDCTGLTELGQFPYLPPSPAGWPGDRTWLSATQAHARMLFLAQEEHAGLADLQDGPDLLDVVLDRCGLFDVGSTTRAALDALDGGLRADPAADPVVRASALITAALLSPEAALA